MHRLYKQIPYASKDCLRPALTGIYIQQNKKLSSVATDGHVLQWIADHDSDKECKLKSEYAKVLKLNEMLKEDALDKSQLREVTTSIFIAKSQRGVVRPTSVSGFHEALLKQVENIKDMQMLYDMRQKTKKPISKLIKEAIIKTDSRK